MTGDKKSGIALDIFLTNVRIETYICKKSMPPRISAAEWEVLNVLWDRAPATVAEICAALSKTRKWHSKTVGTFLTRLVDKEIVQVRKQGRANLYVPLRSRRQCIRAEGDSFLRRVFRGLLWADATAFRRACRAFTRRNSRTRTRAEAKETPVMNLMNTALESVIGASLRGSLLIVFVLALRPMLRGRLPMQCIHLLWVLVAAKLLIPGAPQARWSVFNLWRHAQPPALIEAPAAWRVVLQPEDRSAALREGRKDKRDEKDKKDERALAATATRTADRQASQRMLPRLEALLPWIWFTGVAVQLAMIVWSAEAMRRQLRRAAPLIDVRFLALAAECRELLGLRRKIALLEDDSTEGPLVAGFWRPQLVFPTGLQSRLSDQELRFVLLHELAHVRRYDLVTLWLFAIARTLHWFNPLVWIAMRLGRTDLEAACDETVLRRARGAAPAAYGEALLRLVQMISWRRRTVPIAGIVEGRKALRRRIQNIVRHSPMTKLRLTAAVLLVAIVALAFGANEPSQETSASPEARESSSRWSEPQFGFHPFGFQFNPDVGDLDLKTKHRELRWTFASGWKVVGFAAGKPVTISRYAPMLRVPAGGKSQETISLSVGDRTKDGVQFLGAVSTGFNQCDILLSKGTDVVSLPYAVTDPANIEGSFATGCRILGMTIRAEGDHETATVRGADALGGFFLLESKRNEDGVPWIESFQAAPPGKRWKVTLQKGEERAELFVDAALVNKSGESPPPLSEAGRNAPRLVSMPLAEKAAKSDGPQIEMISRFIEMPAGLAASLAIPGTRLPVPLREAAEERKVSGRPASTIIVQSSEQSEQFSATLSHALDRIKDTSSCSSPTT